MSVDPSDDELFGESNAHKLAFSWDDDDSAAMAVVEIAAAVTGQEPTEMEPLNNVINTDALQRLFAPTIEQSRQSGYVQFEYESCLIRVQSDGVVSAIKADQL